MTVRGYREKMIERLTLSGSPDPMADAEWLLCDALNCSRSILHFSLDDELTAPQESQLESWLFRRELGEPLQYIEGFADFMGLRFSVDTRVLIPRQDTETLCEFALNALQKMRSSTVLDLCTGSGALAVSIAKLCPSSSVTAADLSKDALAVAKQNAQAHDVHIEFAQGDLFDPLSGRLFDLIVCNPPYLTAEELSSLQMEVQREPRMALDGGTDGLIFYRRIALKAAAHLSQNGTIALEVGAGQAEDVRALLNKTMNPVRTGVENDLNGIPRVVWATL